MKMPPPESSSEEEEEEEEEEQEETQAPPPKRGRPARASAAAAAANRAASDDDDDDEDMDESDEESGGGGGRKRRRRKAAAPAAAARKKSGSHKAMTQNVYYCQSQVETQFAFTQAPDPPAAVHDGGYQGYQASQYELEPRDEKALEALSHNEKKQAVAEAVRYILFKAARREPIIRAKLHEEIVKKYGKGLVRGVLKDAATKVSSKEREREHLSHPPPTHPPTHLSTAGTDVWVHAGNPS